VKHRNALRPGRDGLFAWFYNFSFEIGWSSRVGDPSLVCTSVHVHSRQRGWFSGIGKFATDFQACMHAVIIFRRDVVRSYSVGYNTWLTHGRMNCPQVARIAPAVAKSGLHV